MNIMRKLLLLLSVVAFVACEKPDDGYIWNDNWSEEEIDMLLEIALNRHPVRYLLNDDDVNAFYRKIIGMLKKPTEKAKKQVDKKL